MTLASQPSLDSPPWQGHLWAGPGTLQWLPDETLYSLAARHHLLSLHTRSKQTTVLLFGLETGRFRHDFPTSISEVATRSGGRLGSPVSILTKRTSVPFYLPWLTPDNHRALLDHSLDAPQLGLQPRIALLQSSRVRVATLKFCPNCARSDVKEFGVAYWHQAHQYPGCLSCSAHLCLLEQVPTTSRSQYRFALPPQNLVASAWSDWQPANKVQQLLTQCACGCGAEPIGTLFAHTAIQSIYTDALSQRGLVARSGYIKVAAARSELSDFLSNLGERAFPVLVRSRASAAGDLLRVVRMRRQNTHPIRHMLLIAWLFGSWDNFAAALTARYGTSYEPEFPQSLTSKR